MENLSIEVRHDSTYGGELSVTFLSERLCSKPFTIDTFDSRDSTFDHTYGLPTRLDMLIQQLRRITGINSPIEFTYDGFSTTCCKEVNSRHAAALVREAIQMAYRATFPWVIVNDGRPDTWLVCVGVKLTDTDEADEEIEVTGAVPSKELRPTGIRLLNACRLEDLHVFLMDRHRVQIEVTDRSREEELHTLLSDSLHRTVGERPIDLKWQGRG